MIGLVPNATPLFAVISVRRVPQCEHLVIAYSDEKALRDLLAKPSIVALGYSSREEAQISISRDGTRHMRREAMANLVADKTRACKGFLRTCLVAKGTVNLRNTQGTLCGLLQQTLAAAIVVFYSKNALCAAVRALVSF